MFVPSKHENLQTSIVVLGADLLKSLNKKPYNIDELYREINVVYNKDISLNQYYNTLTFLWLIDAIIVESFTIKLKKNVY